MPYTIKEVAEKYNLSVHTLRYYEKEGLLPFIERNKQGNRIFSNKDLEWLNIICCLKNTNMPIAKIKEYVDLCIEGPETICKREDMLLKHKIYIESEIENFNSYLRIVDNKINHYIKEQKSIICK
ncbi:MerR family transcriptional regulator [Clostridium botulinum]|uniref:MerR family transcriptional regulator n=1 Tax=Clostridium botulinum TaxID=1491 RepID=A0A6B4JL47_CLOBO|nr:MerR family transcriptional regulator [Clostridium botulinum]EES51191.1 transcriptional regulator, MerR family [Clostridium botulinum E1 str. 'BoNT E Beluga']MBY6760959.1 MerR family transcriptional regulator [Clostridium botulinum]MBY6919749.1 MerR family transcriptional regulator [Clostridium botulinum]MCR1130751.1 MerR family transcriptional regulator [Clostridium botulinum]NFJ57643.1 MerR family transcriptional regulator [Clostridium botulinum]